MTSSRAPIRGSISERDGLQAVKLAVVRARYNPSGGAERFVELAARALQAEGNQISILARQWRPDSDQLAYASHPEVVTLDPFYLGRTWRDWSFARAVKSYLGKARFDLVQSHERIVGLDIYRAGDGVHAAWLERRAARAGRAQRLMKLSQGMSLHHSYLRDVEKRMFESPRLRAVICNSNMVRDEILARFAIDANRLHVIYNGVDLQRFNPVLRDQHNRAMRSKYQIGADDAVLLFIGSGFERKGLNDALIAVARAGNVHLMVVGTDKHQSRYLQQASVLGIEARCHFVGAVNDSRPYYGMADGLILPTIYDPFPNVTLEALASGVPILVSDGCGALEAVEEGCNGFVIPVGRVDTLSQRVTQWRDAMQSPAKAGAMRLAARHSAQRFSLEQMAGELAALYARLLA
jgi:UDP-glucose:(heptosyl)LPS alpha-1,3-glucosyltransferase